jgi:hypothetical protein
VHRNNLSRLASLAIACGLLLLGLHGTASASNTTVPELDPGTASSGVALAVGVTLLLLERFHHRQRNR